MNFISQYNQALHTARTNAAKLEGENQQALQKVQDLEKQYESHIQNLDFDSAKKVKSEIKELESEIETKRDIISILRDPKNQGVVDAAKKAAVEYHNQKEELKQKDIQLHEKAMSKREEYLEAVRDIIAHNAQLTRGHDDLKRLQEVVAWRNPDVVKELKLNVEMLMRGDGGVLPLHPYLFQTVSKFYDQR